VPGFERLGLTHAALLQCPYFDSNLLKVKGQRVCDMEVERGRPALYQGTASAGFSRAATHL
jgi:hypothetical protein